MKEEDNNSVTVGSFHPAHDSNSQFLEYRENYAVTIAHRWLRMRAKSFHFSFGLGGCQEYDRGRNCNTKSELKWYHFLNPPWSLWRWKVWVLSVQKEDVGCVEEEQTSSEGEACRHKQTNNWDNEHSWWGSTLVTTCMYPHSYIAATA